MFFTFYFLALPQKVTKRSSAVKLLLTALPKTESFGDFLRQATELPQLLAVFASLHLQKVFKAHHHFYHTHSHLKTDTIKFG